MRPVQFVLILMLLGVLMLYFSRLRSGLLDRVVVLAFGLLGITMVVVPDFTTTIANLVGVGRGADLFFYLAIVGMSFVGLVLYSKIRSLEETITQLARAFATERAHTTQPADTHEPGPGR
jgi:small membrane protein